MSTWPDGEQPDGAFGVSVVINWQFVLILTQTAKLENWLGETKLASRCERMVIELFAVITLLENLIGELQYGGKIEPLKAGRQTFTFTF